MKFVALNGESLLRWTKKYLAVRSPKATEDVSTRFIYDYMEELMVQKSMAVPVSFSIAKPWSRKSVSSTQIKALEQHRRESYN